MIINCLDKGVVRDVVAKVNTNFLLLRLSGPAALSADLIDYFLLLVDR